MRPSPSIVPGIDRYIYLVLDDYGRVGRAWAETDEDHTSLDAGDHGPAARPIPQADPRDRFQHRRRLIPGGIGRRRAGAAETVR